MRYQGGKRWTARHILPIILADRTDDQWYIEPFVGGANVIKDVPGDKRVGCDINRYIIATLDALSKGWIPPGNISKEQYSHIQNNMHLYPPEIVGFYGAAASYRGKFFGGYASRYTHHRKGLKAREPIIEYLADCIRSIPRLRGCIFVTADYRDLIFPPKSLIYCDPPYDGTLGYKGIGKFDSLEFWNWARRQKQEGHTVFVSESQAPDDFTCVWGKEVYVSTSQKSRRPKRMERLYR